MALGGRPGLRAFVGLCRNRKARIRHLSLQYCRVGRSKSVISSLQYTHFMVNHANLITKRWQHKNIFVRS
jgi:hypothetical protein